MGASDPSEGRRGVHLTGRIGVGVALATLLVACLPPTGFVFDRRDSAAPDMGVDASPDAAADATGDRGEDVGMEAALAVDAASDASGVVSDAGGDTADAVPPADVCTGRVCSGQCVDTQTDPTHCGTCGMTCASTQFGRAVCQAGFCSVECMPGYHLCGASCVADDSITQCGASCAPCSVPSNASRVTCSNMECVPECNTGYVRRGAACEEIAPPRPIAPASASIQTSTRPVFRWELPAGVTGAVVEVCPDRACSSVTVRIVADGASTVRAPSPLPRGMWFWRLRGRSAGAEGPRASVVWEFQASGFNGSVVGTAGTVLDPNGDGFADVAVAAPPVRKAFVYAGSGTGVAAEPATTLAGTDMAPWSGAIANAGDVNGDGFADLVVGGAPGRVYVYGGSGSGLATIPATVLEGSGDFGWAVAGAGDVNGDGFADVAVGSPGADSDSGRVFLYLGSATGLSTTPATTLMGQPSEALGFSVAGAGDVDADGFGDLAVTAGEGVRVFHGTASGLSNTSAPRLIGPMGTLFGQFLAGAGDVNGDGYPDLVVAAPYQNSGDGAVHIYLGSAGGIAPEAGSVVSGSSREALGRAVASAGDVNNDGFADVVIGTGFNGVDDANVAYLYLGIVSGIQPLPTSILSGASGDGFGRSVAGAGDTNRDGFADVVVGAPDVNGCDGRAFVYVGASMGLPPELRTTLVAPTVSGCFGSRVAM